MCITYLLTSILLALIFCSPRSSQTLKNFPQRWLQYTKYSHLTRSLVCCYVTRVKYGRFDLPGGFLPYSGGGGWFAHRSMCRCAVDVAINYQDPSTSLSVARKTVSSDAQWCCTSYRCIVLYWVKELRRMLTFIELFFSRVLFLYTAQPNHSIHQACH